MAYRDTPQLGSPYWQNPVANFASLPTGANTGEVRLTLNTGSFYEWNGSAWVLVAGGGSGISIGDPISGGTVGSILFVGTGPVLAQDNANFFWDDSNNRLGLGTTSPGTALDVRGSLTLLSTANILPTANAVNAINIANAAGTGYVAFDTTNSRVGIGTAAPGTALDVRGNVTLLGASDIRPTANSTAAIKIANASGTAQVNFDTTNGRVGIGIVPTALLDVSGLKNTTQVAIHVGDWTAVGDAGSLDFLNTHTSDTVVGRIRVLADTTPAFASAMSFWTGPGSAAGATPTEKMRILGNGNVGIGTTAPGTTLDVRGNITILGGSDIRPTANSTSAINFAQADGTDFMSLDTTNKRVAIGNTAPSAPLDVQVLNFGASPQEGISIKNPSAAAAGTQQYSPRLRFTGQGWKTDATAASRAVDWVQTLIPVQGTANPTSYLDFQSQVNAGGYTSRMSLTSDGNVGIGTTTPTSKLDLNGGTLTADGILSKSGDNLSIASQGNGTTVTITTASTNAATSGAISVTSGVTTSSGTTGAATFGSGVPAGGSNSGAVTVSTAGVTADASSGPLTVRTGSLLNGSGNSGEMYFITGNGGGSGNVGSFNFTGGSSGGSGNGGNFGVSGGFSNAGTGGNISLTGGDSSGGAGGAVAIFSGTGGAGQGNVTMGIKNTLMMQFSGAGGEESIGFFGAPSSKFSIICPDANDGISGDHILITGQSGGNDSVTEVDGGGVFVEAGAGYAGGNGGGIEFTTGAVYTDDGSNFALGNSGSMSFFSAAATGSSGSLDYGTGSMQTGIYPSVPGNINFSIGGTLAMRILGGTPPTTYPEPTADLVGWWKLDENSGTTTADSSGNGYDGELTVDTLWSGGKILYGVDIPETGAGTDYVEIPDTATGLDLDFPLSFGGWVYRRDPSFQVVPVSRDTQYELRWTADEITATFTFDIDGELSFTSSGHEETGWHHIFCVYDGTDVRLYLDGVLLDSPTGETDNITPATVVTHIGDSIFGGGQTLGIHDDIRIYNVALSGDQVAQLATIAEEAVSGYIGINKTVPHAFLEINGNDLTPSVGGQEVLRISANYTVTGSGPLIAFFNNDDANGSGSIRGYNGSPQGLMIAGGYGAMDDLVDTLFVGPGVVGINTDVPAYALDVTGEVNATKYNAGTTPPVADGTYTVGNRITPVTGDLGTITVTGGIITAIQEAT